MIAEGDQDAVDCKWTPFRPKSNHKQITFQWDVLEMLGVS